MKRHAGARGCPHCRSLMVSRVLEEGRAVADVARLAMPLLAASLVRSGRKPEGEQLLRDYLAANPDVTAATVVALMRSSHPVFVEGRDRMIASLREIGLQ